MHVQSSVQDTEATRHQRRAVIDARQLEQYHLSAKDMLMERRHGLYAPIVFSHSFMNVRHFVFSAGVFRSSSLTFATLAVSLNSGKCSWKDARRASSTLRSGTSDRLHQWSTQGRGEEREARRRTW